MYYYLEHNKQLKHNPTHQPLPNPTTAIFHHKFFAVFTLVWWNSNFDNETLVLKFHHLDCIFHIFFLVVVVTVPAGSDIKIPCYRKRKNIIVIVISIFILIALVALASVLAALFIAKDAGKGLLFFIYVTGLYKYFIL